jgi:hypothetical protein
MALAVIGGSFGFVEGAVVVYLRELSCPAGFQFPLVPLPPRVLATEVAREAATIALLLGVAFACAREGFRRFAVFAFSFGVWDLAYYATLKAVLGWPQGWLTWDVLFLIPAAWSGPILAPVLVSVALVVASALLLSLPPGVRAPLRLRDWLLQAAAGLLIVLSFLWNAPQVAAGSVPGPFPWWLLGGALIGGVAGFGRRWAKREGRLGQGTRDGLARAGYGSEASEPSQSRGTP